MSSQLAEVVARPRRDLVKSQCHARDKERANASVKSALAKRRGGPKHPTTAEIDYEPYEVQFSMAVSGWRSQNPGRFPTNQDLLKLLVKLGWRLVGEGHKVVPLQPGDEGYSPAPDLRVYAG